MTTGRDLGFELAPAGDAAGAAREVRIVGVDAARCTYVLDSPLRFGPARYEFRDYVLLRFRTDAGIDGYAVGLGRGTPLLEAARPAAEAVLGADPLAALARVRELRRSNAPGDAALVRGHSLVDLGLWDLLCKVAERPLHRLLGEPSRERFEVLAAGGYLLDARGEEAIVAELVEFRDRGYRHLKLMLGSRQPAWLHRFLARCLEAIGPQARLAVDFHFSFASLAEAVRACGPLDELGLAFLEDPFPPLRWRNLRRLSESIRTPLAGGEDVPDSACYADVLEGAAKLRVDAGTCGGLADAIAGIDLASSAGRPVIPHGSPWLGAQLAAVHEAVELVEIAPSSFDNGDRVGELFTASALKIDGAGVRLGEAPGLDVELDWDRVDRRAERTWSVDSP